MGPYKEETSQVLTRVLRVVNNVDEANSESRKISFQGVVQYLASELFNPSVSVNVRKNVQSCLALLASRTGSEVSELLEPLYQPLLQPLMRPLRSKTVEQQVGTVTALNFCLALRPPLLKLTPDLVNFLQEALHIAEADESIWIVKFMSPKVAPSVNKLRTACIELLCTAMVWADFKTANHAELRAKIIAMFFKSLTSRAPEIVAAAKDGLRQVKESKWIVKCFLNYLRHDKNEVNVLFEILSIFLHHTRIDYTFLKEFYIIEVAEGYPPDLKKNLLLHFLNIFQSQELAHVHVVIIMQMLILPMLAHSFQNGQSWEVVDPTIIKTIVDKLLDPPEEVSVEYDEPLRIELLQLKSALYSLHKKIVLPGFSL